MLSGVRIITSKKAIFKDDALSKSELELNWNLRQKVQVHALSKIVN